MSTFFADKTKMFLYFSQVSVCNAVCVFFSVFVFFFKFVCRRRISEGSEVTQQSVIWRDVFTTKLVRLIQIFTTRIFHECFSDFDYMKPTPLDTSSSAFRPSTFRPGWR